MGELETEYGDRVDFHVVSAEETARRHHEIVAFGFEKEQHGLVAFDAEGTPQYTLPGHQFGESEIRRAVEAVLAE